jgi:predicted DNA-binding WGR domain protein
VARRFEFRDARSSKFWEVSTRGSELVVRFGRIGSAGQTKTTAFTDERAAAAAAAKLVREKVGKGYVEIAPAPAPAVTPQRASCFLAADDVLFARGFPAMHVLSEEPVTVKKASALAREALDAIDPVLPVIVPRDVLRRFVKGYLVGRHWGYGPKVTVLELPDRVAQREAALASDAEVEVADLDAFLAAHCPAAKQWKTAIDGKPVNVIEDETYGWRLAEMIHAFEVLLGDTELVARKLQAALLRAHGDPDAWGSWGRDRYCHNASAHHLAFALASLRPRLAPATWCELVGPMRDLASERLLVFSDLLACLADDGRKPVSPFYETPLAIRRGDVAGIRAAMAASEPGLWSSEVPWLLGGAAFEGLPLGAAKKLPAWRQVRLLDEVGRLALPELVPHVVTLLESRAARAEAAAWLAAHADFARPELERAVGAAPDAAARERLRAGFDAIGGKQTKPSRALSEDELDKELAALFDGLEAKLVACRGNRKKERAVMERTFEAYCEARAAAGEVLPEAYFGHELIDWSPKDAAAAERWVKLAADVQDGR